MLEKQDISGEIAGPFQKNHNKLKKRHDLGQQIRGGKSNYGNKKRNHGAGRVFNNELQTKS